MRAITAKATPAAPSQMVCLDTWNGPALGVAVFPSGGATFTVDYSYDDPNDLVSPVALGSMSFFTDMVPSTAIGGAGGITFAMAVAPIWMRLRLLNGQGIVRATYTQLQSPIAGAIVTGPPPTVIAPVNSGAPVVTGTGTVGQTLSCSSGSWLNSPTSFAFQWQRGGVNIAGATASTYLLVTADALNTVSCVVTASNSAGSASSGSNSISVAAASAPTNTVLPAVTGTATVGSALSCSTGTWTGTPTGYTFQWQRSGSNIAGATASSYTLVFADGGTSITCIVTATNSNGSTSATSNSTSVPVPVPTNTVAPAISGTVAVGSTLTCSQGTWTNSPTGYAYQWQQNGINIAGQTTSTYVPVAGDVNQSIRCVVTASNAGGAGSPANSNAVSVPLPAPVNTVAPVASGSTSIGSTLSVTTGTWNWSPTFTYQWRRGGVNIAGATGSTYVTVSADGGTNVTCNVTGTNASGNATATSNAIAVAAPFSFPAGATAIFSTRLAVSGYAGKCLQLQNSVGTTQDIGFDGTGNIDVAAAQAFSGYRITKWYDQSGNANDATSTNPTNTPLTIVNGKGLVCFDGGLFALAGGAVNADQTLGLVMWPTNTASDMFVLTHYSGPGWMIMANHGAPAKGVYWAAAPGAFNATAANLTNRSPSRLVFTRTSGTVQSYVNGATSGSWTGQSNSAASSHINIGGYQDASPGFGGFISEVFIYGSALSSGQLSTIDASEAAFYPTIGLETPYNGQAHWVQFGASQNISLGLDTLAYEYNQPWTAFAVVQVYDPTTYKIVFTNVPNPSFGSSYPGYELWFDNNTGPSVLHVKLMHNYSDTGKPNPGSYAGLIGSVNICDGQKHVVCASWDGSGNASGISLFVDGVKDTHTTVESDTLGGMTIVSPGNQTFFVGNQNGINFGTGGGMSYFQLDKVKRSDAYIAGIFPGSTTPVPPVDANTAVCLVLNAGSGTTAVDSSGNGHTGTMSDSGMWLP